MKFICETCKSEQLQNIECHGHRISYKDGYFVCNDCGGMRMMDEAIEECLPKCCKKSMQPIG